MYIDKIKEYIQKNGLDKPNQNREMVYSRFYLFSVLKAEGLGYSEIARIFNLKHCTVIYGIKNHNYYEKVKDNLYLKLTYELRNTFKHRKRRNIFKDILEANTLEEFLTIKKMIEDCKY